jgi:protein-S-isoprenylcysteine O-methyltransferase Ste14
VYHKPLGPARACGGNLLACMRFVLYPPRAMDQRTLYLAMLESAWITAKIGAGFGLLLWIAGALVARSQPRARAAHVAEGARPRALAQLAALLVGGALVALTRDEALGLPAPAQAVIAATAALLGPLGGMLGAWTAKTLGSALVFDAEAHDRLVTTGPFGIVRHPFYLSLALWAAGFGLALGSLSGTAVLIVFYLAASAWRARLEDRVLAEAFPQDFPAWAARVRGFLPKI